MTRQNVLFLSIDALRRDRTSLFGYHRPTTPNLDQFAGGALSCTAAFSLGPFTQSAFVQTMTSSRPLSYGGYDRGATGRPTNLFQQFKDAGYHTIALSTLHWVNRYFGYGDGLDEEHQLFVVNTLIGVAVANMRNSLRGYFAGTINTENMLGIVVPVVEKAFDNICDYAESRLTNERALSRDYPHAQLICAGYNYSAILKIIAKHQREFRQDPEDYVKQYLDPIPRAHEWLAKDWRWSRKPSWFLKEGSARAASAVLRPFTKTTANGLLNRHRSYVDAGSIADKVIERLSEQAGKGEKPFFLWAHFMDTHLPYNSGYGKAWYRQSANYLAAVGHDPAIDPSLAFDRAALKTVEGMSNASHLYDAALRWTDQQLGRIFDALDTLGFAENTIVAIMGDHGEEFGEHGFIGHYFLPSEGNIQVPILFRNPGTRSGTIDGLVSHMDIAPTLAEMAGVPCASGWEGNPVTSTAIGDRDHLMMETFFGGNCIFDQRALYMGIRTRDHKYIWKEYRDPADSFSAEGNELYDLANDPNEKSNIYRPDHPVALKCDQLIANRLAELPEISDERIIKRLGDIGRCAVQEYAASC